MKIEKCYRTQKFNLSVYLYSKNQTIVGVNSITPKTKEFAFLNTEELDELIDIYRFGNKEDQRLLVPVHKYEQARNELLDMLND